MIGATPGRLAVVVLAAGAGSRFGGGKLVVSLEGRPMLQHVLDAIADAPLREVVVVTRPDADSLEEAIAWRTERRVANLRPQDGLASSLKVGLAALEEEVQGALVVLADQPRIRSIVIRRVADAWRGSGGPIVAARYSRDGAPNPVLLDRSVWPLAFGLTGDRGMGAVLRERPGLVRWIDVAGDNPDVDTRADLEQLAGEGSE